MSESLTKVILFLLKKSISLEDQPPSGPITFQKIPPFLFPNSCCFLNHLFKSYSVSSLVIEIETLSSLSLLFSHSIISIPFKIDGFHNLSLCSTASLIIEFHLKSFLEKFKFLFTCLSENNGCIKSIPISVHIFKISSKPLFGITTAIPNK